MVKKRTKLLLVTLLVAVALFFLLEMNFLPGLFSQSVPPKPFEILGWVIKLIKDDYVEVPDAYQDHGRGLQRFGRFFGYLIQLFG